MTDMFALAVKAELPLIAIQTDDPINIHTVVEHILEQKVGSTATKSVQEKGVYFYTHNPKDWKAVYKEALKKDSVFLVVNPSSVAPEMYNAGFIKCPVSLIENYIDTFHRGNEKKSLVHALNGLNYKNIRELCQLTYKKYGDINKEYLEEIRRNFFSLPTGLIDVTKKDMFYIPNQKVKTWLEKEAPFLKRSPMDCLKPRGLIFEGSPGVGKTLGAQYIANQLNIPIYLLDIGILMNKYVGESEKNLEACLRTIENMSPCVMLIDEVEKMFVGSSNDTSTRLLGRLLWWLQSRESDTLTVMTTNDLDKIPPELWRPGRIDRKMWFSKLDRFKEVPDFVGNYLDTFSGILGETEKQVIYDRVCHHAEAMAEDVSHSNAVQWVLSAVKEELLNA